MAKTIFSIFENGIIRCKEDYDFEGENTLDELYLEQNYFDSLYQLIVMSQKESFNDNEDLFMKAI